MSTSRLVVLVVLVLSLGIFGADALNATTLFQAQPDAAAGGSYRCIGTNKYFMRVHNAFYILYIIQFLILIINSQIGSGGGLYSYDTTTEAFTLLFTAIEADLFYSLPNGIIIFVAAGGSFGLQLYVRVPPPPTPSPPTSIHLTSVLCDPTIGNQLHSCLDAPSNISR